MTDNAKRPLYLKKIPTGMTGVLSILFLGLVIVFDRLTGTEIPLTYFYLLPVVFSAWFSGVLMSSGIALMSSAAVYCGGQSPGTAASFSALLVFNAAIQCSFLIAAGWLLSLVRTRIEPVCPKPDTDPVTGLANEKQLLSLILHENECIKRYNRLFSIAYFDVEPAESAGAAMGNQIVCSISETLQCNLRVTDIVFRLQGNSFAVLFTETGFESAENAVQKCRHYLQIAMEEYHLSVVFSIVVLSFNSAFDDINEVMIVKEKLMSSVKKSGSNKVRHLQWGNGRGGSDA